MKEKVLKSSDLKSSNLKSSGLKSGDLKLSDLKLSESNFNIGDKKIGHYLITVPLFFIAGILSTNCILFGNIAPFSAALTAAAPFYGALFVMGGIISSSVIGFSALKMQYIIIALVILTAKWALAPSNKIKNNIFFLMSLSFITPFIFSFVFANITNFSTSAEGQGLNIFLKAFAESSVCSGLTYFFIKVFGISEREKSLTLKNLKSSERVCLFVLSGIIISALSAINVFGFSIGHIIAVVVILNFSVTNKEAGGAISGVFCGIAVAIVNTKYLFLAGSFGFGGILSGMFAKLGKAASGGIFIISNLIVIALTKSAELSIFAMAEVIVGTLIFFLIPKKLIEKTQTILLGEKVNDNLSDEMSGVFKSIGMKLNFASKAYADIANTFEKVNKEMDNISVNRECLTDIFVKTADFTCKKCKQNALCWQKQYNDLIDGFDKTAKILSEKGSITMKDFDTRFLTVCPNVDKISEYVNFIYNEYYLKNTFELKEKSNYMNQAYLEQFNAVGRMVSEFSDELSILESYDKKSAKKVEKLLKRFCFRPFDVTVSVDKYQRMFIDFLISTMDYENLNRDFYNQINITFDRKFAEPSVFTCLDTTKISLFEKADFSVSSSVVQYTFDGENYCGDKTDKFVSSNGNLYYIISDGMGKGTQAALSSTMSTALFSKLIKGNFGVQSALKTVNSMLIAKQGEESLATIDVAMIDTYTGKATFYKAGAAESFVIRKNKILTFESKSTPAGILAGAQFDEQEITLFENDIIIMVSDGVIGDDYSWIYKIIEKTKNRSCEDIANSIATYAKKVINNKDDITAFVMKLKK